MAGPTVAVIGAGFSGLLTAVHLLRTPGLRVTLIERGARFATGAAYGTDNPDHLLNVRLGNMSAFPDQPDHLTQWLATQSRWNAQDGFITRGVYGEYLRAILAEAMADGETGPRLKLVQGEAVALTSAGGGWRIALRDENVLEARAVVLALGNIEPHTPAGVDPELIDTWRYVADPWRAAVDLPPQARRVLLIGTGLTMIDAALSLRAPGRRLLAISRRGLLPRSHGHGAPVASRTPHRGRPADVLRQVRMRAAQAPWREAVDDVRQSARDLWRGWSPRERASALRHLRPHWDVHRHRLAPAVAQKVHAMIASGELSVMAGRISALTLDGDQVRLSWRPRGAPRSASRRLDAVVNCTGPLGDLSFSRSILIRSLLDQGLIAPDAHGLGARVDDDCRLQDASGAPAHSLYAVGPMTRAAFWEVTSVPDLRLQARDVAAAVAASVANL